MNSVTSFNLKGYSVSSNGRRGTFFVEENSSTQSENGWLILYFECGLGAGRAEWRNIGYRGWVEYLVNVKEDELLNNLFVQGYKVVDSEATLIKISNHFKSDVEREAWSAGDPDAWIQACRFAASLGENVPTQLFFDIVRAALPDEFLTDPDPYSVEGNLIEFLVVINDQKSKVLLEDFWPAFIEHIK